MIFVRGHKAFQTFLFGCKVDQWGWWTIVQHCIVQETTNTEDKKCACPSILFFWFTEWDLYQDPIVFHIPLCWNLDRIIYYWLIWYRTKKFLIITKYHSKDTKVPRIIWRIMMTMKRIIRRISRMSNMINSRICISMISMISMISRINMISRAILTSLFTDQLPQVSIKIKRKHAQGQGNQGQGHIS